MSLPSRLRNRSHKYISMRMCVCVYMCACVRACVRESVRQSVRECVSACVRACVCVLFVYFCLHTKKPEDVASNCYHYVHRFSQFTKAGVEITPTFLVVRRTT